MKIRILGRQYNLRFTNLKNDWGRCDNPETPNPKILISKDAKGKTELRNILHECTHAGDFTKDESWVDQFSKDLTDILWKLGYRRSKGE